MKQEEQEISTESGIWGITVGFPAYQGQNERQLDKLQKVHALEVDMEF